MYRRMATNPARMDRDDEKRMLPCRYFMAGFCHKGVRCKFYHPNMHVRDPCIRVPELPSNFSRIQQHGGQFDQNPGVPSLLEMTGSRGARSKKVKSRQASPIGLGVSTPSMHQRGRNDGFAKHVLSPTSHAYSEFLACSREQQQELQQEEDLEDYPNEDSKPVQNTVFNHIDWSEFLAPGVCPPPPTLVPEQCVAMSPVRDFDTTVTDMYRQHGSTYTRALRPVVKLANEDMPPEGSQVTGRSSIDHSITGVLGSPSNSKLSAKEELQLKVKQIAQELADEPIQHVRSLDSFFRNFKFNGPPNNTIHTTRLIVTEEDEEEGNADDGNKENADQNTIDELSEEENDVMCVPI